MEEMTLKQYWITMGWIDRFESVVSEKLLAGAGPYPPRIHQAIIEGYQSQIESLREQIADYEAIHGIPEPQTQEN